MNQPMDLRRVRYFIAVAEELHFGRAAQRLHLAQPPLSQQIRHLEEELGLRLFERTSRKVSLTEAGRVFLEQAYLVVNQADKASATMQAVRRGDAGRLTIGVIASALYSIIPAILREFHQARPGVEIRCYEMNSSEQLQALLERRIQLGFARHQLISPLLRNEVLLKERLVLALPSTDPRAHRGPISLRQFSQDGFLMFTRDRVPVVYDAAIASCKKVGFSPILAQEAHDIHMMLALTAAGVGVCLVPESFVNLSFPGIAYQLLSKAESEELSVSLVWRKDDHSILVDAALELARRVASQKT